MSDLERAKQSMQKLFDYARSEHRISLLQADASRQNKDFRQCDRERYYAAAMQKIKNKISQLAREQFGFDVHAIHDGETGGK